MEGNPDTQLFCLLTNCRSIGKEASSYPKSPAWQHQKKTLIQVQEKVH